MKTPFRLSSLLAITLLLAIALPARAGIQYVIVITVDGCRGDFLQAFIEEPAVPTSFPNFKRLRDGSAYTFNARTDFSQTVTVCDHISVITGRPVNTTGGVDKSFTHGITSDAPQGADTIHVYAAPTGNNSGPYKASIFDMVHDRGLSTAIYLSKNKIALMSTSYNATNGAADITGGDNGKDKIDFRMLTEAMGNANATPSLITDLKTKIAAGTLKNFTFLHIADTDYAGHNSAWTTSPGTYRNAQITADGWIGQILDAIQGNATLAEKVALVLTADHGGGDPTNHHTVTTNVVNNTIPFFIMGPGFTPGSNLYTYFENRYNPGSTRPAEVPATANQPIRNGDVANVVATLIGVPPVTGSYWKSEFKKPLTVSTDAGGNYMVNWPVYLTGSSLESCDDLSAAPQVWATVSSNIADTGGTRTHTVTNPAPNARYFRLRTPQ